MHVSFSINAAFTDVQVRMKNPKNNLRHKVSVTVSEFV